MMATHYERLGVDPDADRDTIWRAYLAAVREALTTAHPQQELGQLDEAWEHLRDPQRRAAYDRSVGLAGENRDAERDELIDLLDRLARSGRIQPTAAPPEPTRAETPGATAAGDVVGQVPDPPIPASPEPAAEHPADARPEATPDSPEREVTPDTHHGPEAAPAPPEPAAAPAPAPAAARTTRPADSTPRRSPREGSRLPEWIRSPALGAAVWLLACAVVGAGAGLVVQTRLDPGDPFAQGRCVALTPTEALPAACDAAEADARVSAVTADAEACPEADAGWVTRPDGQVACLALLDR